MLFRSPELIELLAAVGKVWIQTHFNHPVEITPETSLACRNLTGAGMPVNNHTVLMKGINDNIATMRELSAQYPRFGYRRIHVFLGRQGHLMSPDRAHRLWRQAGLQVPRRRPRRRISTGRPRPVVPLQINHVWTYDFVFDACANGDRKSTRLNSSH